MRILLAALLICLPATALACATSFSDTTQAKLCTNANETNCKTILHADIQGNLGNAPNREEVRQSMQAFLDVRQFLTDLPLDDPDRGCSFENTDFFFCGDIDGGKKTSLDATHIVSRECEVTDVQFVDGQYRLTLTRTR